MIVHDIIRFPPSPPFSVLTPSNIRRIGRHMEALEPRQLATAVRIIRCSEGEGEGGGEQHMHAEQVEGAGMTDDVAGDEDIDLNALVSEAQGAFVTCCLLGFVVVD